MKSQHTSLIQRQSYRGFALSRPVLGWNDASACEIGKPNFRN
jgi:hypothetical protein